MPWRDWAPLSARSYSYYPFQSSSSSLIPPYFLLLCYNFHAIPEKHITSGIRAIPSSPTTSTVSVSSQFFISFPSLLLSLFYPAKFFLASVIHNFFFLFVLQSAFSTMAPLWQHPDAHLSRQNRYAGMSQDLLMQKILELVDQMQETMKASVENTRRFGRHLHTLKHNLLEPFDAPPQSVFLQDAIDDSITATKFEPMDESSVPAVTEPNVAVHLWSVNSRAMNEPPLPSKINLLDAQPVTEVLKQNVEKSFPPLFVCDNKEQLLLAYRSVVLQLVVQKHRWRWKPVDDVGSHRAPRVFSSCGCYNYMSLTYDEEAMCMDATRCTNGCYVAVDYLRHLNDHNYVAFAKAEFYFLKIGHALFQAWPRLLETQQPVPSQIWRFFVFQHSTKWAKVWILNIHVNFWRISHTLKHIVAFKPQWRWKFPWWRTLWVSIPGGRDLLHLSWKRKGRVPKSGGRGLQHIFGYPIAFLIVSQIVSQIFMILAQAPRAKFMGQKGESVAVSAPLLEETQRIGTVELDHVPSWREHITLKELVVSAVLWTLFCIISHKLNLTARIILSLNISSGMLRFFFFKSWSNSCPCLAFQLKFSQARASR